MGQSREGGLGPGSRKESVALAHAVSCPFQARSANMDSPEIVPAIARELVQLNPLPCQGFPWGKGQNVPLLKRDLQTFKFSHGIH